MPIPCKPEIAGERNPRLSFEQVGALARPNW